MRYSSHHSLTVELCVLTTTVIALGSEAAAQPPSSIAGHTLEFVITSGSGRMAASGTYRFTPSALNSVYGIVPVAGSIAALYGNYQYQTNDRSTAILTYTSGQSGPGFLATCTFTDPGRGTYILTNPGAPGDHQEGTFQVFLAPVPLSIAGSTITMEITGKVGDYNGSGSCYLLPALDGTFRIIGIKGVGNHTGQYFYEVSSPTTSMLRVYDEVTGTWQFQQLSFRDAGFGAYLIQAEATPGFQTGTFTYLPAVILSAPGLAGEQMQFTFNVNSNRSYTIEFTTTLSPAFWRTLVQFPSRSGATDILIADPVGLGQRFYRARAQ